MAVDVSRTNNQYAPSEQDTAVVRKMMFIAGGALVLLVAIKLGFLHRVFP